MNIIDDLESLLKDLKNQFRNVVPIIHEEKIIHNKKEFVLETDIFSQSSLMSIAKKYHPTAKVISEELDNYHDISPDNESMVIMDPLDGTHNYLYGLPMWGFSYTVFSESRLAVESYIGLPMLDMLIAYNNQEITVYNLGADHYLKRIQIQSSKKNLSQMMIAYDNQFNKDPIIIKSNYNLLIDNTFTTRISGSAIFDIAMIVVGKLDARIWHSTEIYDVAPAYAFLNKSGGVVNLNTDEDAILGDKAIIASTNNSLFQQLQAIGFKRELDNG